MSRRHVRAETTTARGLVLRRGVLGESDRQSVIYTDLYGKLPVRFMGVNRPLGKLKALSEPLALGEYRLHIREGAGGALCIGGALESVHVRLRADLPRLLRGMQVCELMDRLTPVAQPNLEKFQLALEALRALEAAADEASCDWVLIAFSLRLMEQAGYGVGELPVGREHRPLWESLHAASFQEICALPADPDRRGRLEGYLQRSVERLTERPLHTLRMRAQVLAA
ncbi:MAG: DNA repair protein RecO [Elusimicrobiota bacterium]|jgi:DNA repair protein RecO